MKTTSLAGLILALISTAPAGAQPVTLTSLLRDMTDRDTIARWPQPAYTTRQASSYDRASERPDDPQGWFANHDYEQYIREELNAGRPEWVLMDDDGPGCVTRMWLGGEMPTGRLRFYLDGAAVPAIDAPAYDLLSGHAFVKGPLSIENSPLAAERKPGGMNLFLPIPYARHCKITYGVDGAPRHQAPRAFWYNIEHRTYAPGTAVQTFTLAALQAAQPQIEQAGRELLETPAPPELRSQTLQRRLTPGEEASLALPPGPAAVRQMEARIEVGSPPSPEQVAQALRSTVLVARMDGEATVWCPLGDFFGSGAGLNPLRSWQRTVAADGTLTCRWTMPYESSARFTLLNLGTVPVTVRLTAGVGDSAWDARSMHFHATWRQQRGIPTRPFSDWNYLEVDGQGVYVGDVLSVFNTTQWWGEGDEKVYVDGEGFPSHFGTGTEDHYGYAWGNTVLFQGPFSNEVRADGANGRHEGHTVVTRTRDLDAIPFTRQLRYDMEIWHWNDTRVNYAATTYWYARPGALSNRGPAFEEAASPLPSLPRPRQIVGALEMESLPVVEKAPGVVVETQRGSLLSTGQWSGGAQMFVRATKVGDFIEVSLPAPDNAPHKITVYPTRSYDYGVLKFSVNGQEARMYDAYEAKAIAGDPLVLGTFTPRDGKFVLRVEVAGANVTSRDARYYFGLDAVTLETDRK